MKHQNYLIGEWRLDPGLDRVWRGTESIPLQRKTVELLIFFARHPGEVLSRGEILEGVWGETIVSDSVIYWNINQLRSVLESDEDGSRYIETVPRRGYRLVAPVREVASGPVAAWPASHRRISLLASVAVLLVAALTFWTTRDSPVSPAHSSSLAVLPFVNMTENEENEHLADGLTEELLNTLANVEGLRVIARTSSFYFKGRDEDVRDIAKALGVSHVIEGSLRRVGDRIRVTAQLIEADTGQHRWSRTYDRVPGDWLDLQADIALQVANTLQVHFTPAHRQWLARVERVPDEASRLYAEARRVWDGPARGPAAAAHAQALLERALELEPAHAPALAALGRSHVLMISLFGLEPEENIRKARAVLVRMEAAGYEDLADYYLIDAVASRHEMSAYGVTPERLQHIELAYEQAMARNPNDVVIPLSYAIHARRLGDMQRAAELLEHAALLDPLDVGVNLQLARVHSATREEDAVRRARALVVHHPESPLAYTTLAEILASLGRFDEAIAVLLQAPVLEGDNVLMFRFRATYLAMGDRASAMDWIVRSGATPDEQALMFGLKGDWQLAHREMERLIRNQPSVPPRTREWAADAAFLAGNYTQARFQYEAAAPEFVDDADAPITQLNYRRALKLSAAWLQTGEEERALRLLQKLDTWLQGHHRMGYEGHTTSYAESLALQQRFEEAIGELEALFEEGWKQLAGPWAQDWYGEASPLLATLDRDPRYRALVARSEQHLAAMRERANRSMTERTAQHDAEARSSVRPPGLSPRRAR